jgi:hypothetical protein
MQGAVGQYESRTATPALNGVKWRVLVLVGELEVLFLNGAQRSVNRKVQGSNPCPGAKTELGSVRLEPYWG